MSVVELDNTSATLRADLAGVASRLAGQGVLGDTALADPACRLPGELARGLREAVRPPAPDRGYRVLRGLLDTFGDPGPTPGRWSEADRHRTAPFDVALVLVAGLLGRVFGWEEQQGGRMVHNILPTRGCEQQQVGASSTAVLEWHTEDAFHPERADFLLLACVRNDDGVGSRLSCTGSAQLSPGDVERLAEPHVAIRPDESYGNGSGSGVDDVGMATLWRQPTGLAIRYDPSYSRVLTSEPGFVAAYDRLGPALEEGSTTVALEPGDVLVVDNNTTVHGREPFDARYDGTDRWLKRVLVRAGGHRPARERLEHGYEQRQVHPCATGG